MLPQVGLDGHRLHGHPPEQREGCGSILTRSTRGRLAPGPPIASGCLYRTVSTGFTRDRSLNTAAWKTGSKRGQKRLTALLPLRDSGALEWERLSVPPFPGFPDPEQMHGGAGFSPLP